MTARISVDSLGQESNGDSRYPSISGDGQGAARIASDLSTALAAARTPLKAAL